MAHSSLGPPRACPGSCLGGEGPGNITAGHRRGSGLGSRSHLTYSVSGLVDQLVGNGAGAQLSFAQHLLPSPVPSDLVENPGVEGTVWSSPLGGSPQRWSPVERRLGVGHRPCLRFHGDHPPRPACPVPGPWPPAAGIVYSAGCHGGQQALGPAQPEPGPGRGLAPGGPGLGSHPPPV